MKLDFAQNWQNGTKNQPYVPPGAAETEIFGLMGVQPPIQSCPEKIFEFFDFHNNKETIFLKFWPINYTDLSTDIDQDIPMVKCKFVIL